MVDALREAHRVLAEGGILIDARPDSRVDARVQRASGPRFVTAGALGTRRDTALDDRLSDRAIAAAKRLRLFRGRGGRPWWPPPPFPRLLDLRAILGGPPVPPWPIRWSA